MIVSVKHVFILMIGLSCYAGSGQSNLKYNSEISVTQICYDALRNGSYVINPSVGKNLIASQEHPNKMALQAGLSTCLQLGSFKVINKLATVIDLRRATVITEICGCFISSMLTMAFFIMNWDAEKAKINYGHLFLTTLIPWALYSLTITIFPAISLMNVSVLMIISKIGVMLIISALDFLQTGISLAKRRITEEYFVYNFAYLLIRFLLDSVFVIASGIISGIIWALPIYTFIYAILVFFLNLFYYMFYIVFFNELSDDIRKRRGPQAT